MVDELHKRVVESALANGSDKEALVNMTLGELILFHVLLQDYGFDLVDKERLIPLMGRNKARLDAFPNHD